MVLSGIVLRQKKFYLPKYYLLAVAMLAFICFANLSTKYAHSQNAFTSAVVANVETGESLYAYQIDRRIHPASLTKIMTAYIVFDAIVQGSIGLYDKVDLMQYSNIGLPNTFSYKETATIQELLIKLAVNSCNECAVALANEVVNSEYEFVKLMNTKAKELHMSNTHFTNSHGLNHPYHFSTARDIAILSISMIKQHPELSKIFSITDYIIDNHFTTKTTTIQRDNQYISGSKTGYTAESGYNIAMWGEKNGAKIIIVIIGANNKYDRDIIALNIMQHIQTSGNNLLIKNSKKASGLSLYTEQIYSTISNYIREYLHLNDNHLTEEATYYENPDNNRFYTQQ